MPFLKPYTTFLPNSFFSKGLKVVKNLARITVTRVNKRLKPKVIKNNSHINLLARLIEGHDKTNTPFRREEFTTEALTQLIASSNTPSNTACRLLY